MLRQVTLNNGTFAEIDMDRVYRRAFEFGDGTVSTKQWYYGSSLPTGRGDVPVEEIRVGDTIQMKDKSFKKLVRIHWLS
jgi:hypothetical protein